MPLSIEGKSVLITGGTRGIGKGIARVCAGLGASVCIVGRSRGDGAAVAQLLQVEGRSAIFCKGDVRSREDMAQAAAAAAKAFGRIDVLCANAGIFPLARLEEIGPEWDDVLSTNLSGMLLSIQACLPYLKRSSAGRIVLTSSITGPVTGYPGLAAYATSKAGMLGFMRSAALELAKHRITINAVLPGQILTENLQELGPEYLGRMSAAIPFKRLGTVEEIGHTVAFLASDAAGYITGQTLIVDGGQTLPESPLALEE